ncbi:MAG: hypothetical protein J5911_00270 [Clostridia bacterium]|nr:hypothetical protein [Clostridia bacterium]
MSGNLLTPTIIWKNFAVGEIKSEVMNAFFDNGFAVSHLRITGEKTADGEVGIYAVAVRKIKLDTAPAIVLVQDFKCVDLTLAKTLASKGYIVLMTDIAGATDFNLAKRVEGVEKPYTVYPNSLNFANFDEQNENKAEIVGDAHATCWFTWGRVIRYAVEYLKTQPQIVKIGVMGIGRAATPVWQVISAKCDISCAVIVANAGWKGYRGIDKFGDTPEPQFNDDALKYLAGVEPQAYAAHVTCPLLLLSPTNNPDFDIDRAYDTVSRVPEKIYAAADYTVGGRYEISADAFDGALAFLEQLLVKDEPVLAGGITVKGAICEGAVKVEVMPDLNGLKNLSVYFSEEEISPALRFWNREAQAVSESGGVYEFSYTPYRGSGIVTFFARAEYENGQKVCSNIVCKKFDSDKTTQINKRRVFYSSRMLVGVNGFYPAKEVSDGYLNVNLDKDAVVRIKNGPMDIAGLCSKNGLLTFKINAKKYKPIESAMFMFDVYAAGGGELCVKAIVDFFGAKTEYSVNIKIIGDFWQNIQVELNQFKTAEGRALKSYEEVEALEFFADGEFLINNLLWV